MSVTIRVGQGGLLLAAYNGHPDHADLLGTAVRHAHHGKWTITVAGTTRRRRAAQRTLVRLAQTLPTDRTLASPNTMRRPGIAGGVDTWGGAS